MLLDVFISMDNSYNFKKIAIFHKYIIQIHMDVLNVKSSQSWGY